MSLPPHAGPGIPTPRVADKGLRRGALGLLSSVVIGVASTAPAYSTAATLGLVIALVGIHGPGVLIASFVPMLCIAFAFREWNALDPDCGTTFTWTTRAFGPWAGWMGGWGIIAACVVVMSSVSQIAAQYTFLLFGADGLAGNQVWVTVGGVAFIALLTGICYLGIEISARLQFALLAIELLTVLAFAVTALVKAYTGHALPGGSHASLSWFDPFHGSFSSVSDAFLLAVFIYWGWDTALSVNEETKDSARTPGRAAVIATLILVSVFALAGTAVLAFAGPGFLADNSGDLFGALSSAVLGSWAGKVLIVSVLTSAAASTQTTIMPTARATLAMAAHGALPARFSRVHPRLRTPGFSTVAMGVVSALLFVLLSAVSTNVLSDSASAVGLLIAFYYGITGFACTWHFRRTLRHSARDLWLRGILPALGGLVMLGAFVFSVTSYWPADSSSSSFAGIGGIFLIGAGSLLLGVVLMLVCRLRLPDFFAGRTLNAATPTLADADLDAIAVAVSAPIPGADTSMSTSTTVRTRSTL